MKKKVLRQTAEKEPYASPRIKVIEIETIQVMCASVPSATGDRFGGSFGESFRTDNWRNGKSSMDRDME